MDELRHFSQWPVPQRFLSVLTLGELRKGAAMRRLVDPAAPLKLSRWIDITEEDYADRLLGVDVNVARGVGRVMRGAIASAGDTLLAATAIVHGLTLVTRNTRDVADTGVALLNP